MARSVFIGFLLLFFGSISVFAQKDTLSGNVVEKITGEAVPLANVFVKDGNGKIVTFATTDSIGRFTLSVPTGQTGLTINASILGFKTIRHRLSSAISLYLYYLMTVHTN